MIILGIVGNPASGKSTVCRFLHEAGATWINADAIAKRVLQSNDVRDALLNRFGDSILSSADAEDPIDRSAIASVVFGDDASSREALSDLEAIIHPRVRTRIRAELRSAAADSTALAILDVPLLFESGWDLACDSIWCIEAPQESQIRWAAARGWPDGEVARRQANQLPLSEKQRLANEVLQNKGSLQELRDAARSNLAGLI